MTGAASSLRRQIGGRTGRPIHGSASDAFHRGIDRTESALAHVTGMVANAWWSAIGAPVIYEGLSPSEAWDALSYNQKLLLVGVTAWGVRLLYRVASRSLRRGKDDPRYETSARKQPDFWNKAFFTMFLPEALIQALVSLPFTLPFRAPIASALAAPFPEVTTVSHSLTGV